jgi:hypothetical protein
LPLLHLHLVTDLAAMALFALLVAFLILFVLAAVAFVHLVIN